MDILKSILDRYFVLKTGKLYELTRHKLWTKHVTHTSSPRSTEPLRGDPGDILLYLGTEQPKNSPRVRNGNLPMDWWHMFIHPSGEVVGQWQQSPEIRQYPNESKLGVKRQNWCKRAG